MLISIPSPPPPGTNTEAQTISCLPSSCISRSPGFLCILAHTLVSWRQLCPLPNWLSLKRASFSTWILLSLSPASRRCFNSSVHFDHIVWSNPASFQYSALHFETVALRSEPHSRSSHAPPMPRPDTGMDVPHLYLDLVSDFSISL